MLVSGRPRKLYGIMIQQSETGRTGLNVLSKQKYHRLLPRDEPPFPRAGLAEPVLRPPVEVLVLAWSDEPSGAIRPERLKAEIIGLISGFEREVMRVRTQSVYRPTRRSFECLRISLDVRSLPLQLQGQGFSVEKEASRINTSSHAS